MSDNIERAEADTRARISYEDRRKYRGLARHPSARAWLMKQYMEAREKADESEGRTAERWRVVADRLHRDLQRMGVASS